MGNIRAFASSAVLSLAACGGGGSDKPDAAIIVIPDAAPDAQMIDAPAGPVYDFSCMTNPMPLTAPAMITIAGTASAFVLNGTTPSVNPLAGATIDTCKGNCQAANKLDTQTSAADGTFTTAPLTTGGVPLDGYIKVSKTGNTHRTANVYPAAPPDANVTGVPGLVFATAAFNTVTGFLGINQLAANGDVGLIVTDCGLTPIDGATLSLKQGGVEVPNTDVVDAGSLDASFAGTFLVFNVPPGVTVVGASYMGMTFRSHSVTVVAGQTTGTQIRPGF